MFTRRPVLVLTVSLLLVLCTAGCNMRSKQQTKNKAAVHYTALRTAMLMEMARQEFEAGQLDVAQNKLDDAMAVNPIDPRVHLLGGRIALERGELERSFNMLTRANELAPTMSEPLFFRGMVRQRWQKFDAAHDDYTAAFALAPDRSEYLLSAAEMLVQMGQLDDAVALLEEKRQYFDQNAAVRAALGSFYRMKGDRVAAADAFREASTLDPQDNRLLEERALAEAEAGRDEAAADSLERVLEREGYETRDDLRRMLATAQARTGKLREARSTLTLIAGSGRAETDDYVRLGEVAWRLGDVGATLDAASRVIAMSPARHEGYLLSGLVWQKRGRLEQALRMFDRAAELAPTDATPLILRGLALQREGRAGEAAEAYGEALRREPEEPRAVRLLATVTQGVR